MDGSRISSEEFLCFQKSGFVSFDSIQKYEKWAAAERVICKKIW